MTKTKISAKLLSDSFLQLERTNADVKAAAEQPRASCALTGLSGTPGGQEAANVEATPEDTHLKHQECASNVNIGLVTLHFKAASGQQRQRWWRWWRWSVSDDPTDANKMAKTMRRGSADSLSLLISRSWGIS